MRKYIQFISQFKLQLLFLSAFLIRLISINQSLWLDEATTAMTVKNYSFWQIIIQFSPTDFHPPLYYLLMDTWTNVFGYSEISLRMPSVLFSLGTGYVIYHIAKRSFDSHSFAQDDKSGRKLAIWSAAFFLFNPLIIYYSQEARMYSMVTFFVAVSFYYLVKLLNDNSYKNLVLLNTFLILSFYTFYASVFFIAAVFLYLLIKKKYKVLSISSFAFIFSIAIIFPLFSTQYLNSRIALETVQNWSLVLGNVTLKNILLFPIKFTSGRISFEPKMIYYILSGFWAVLIGIILGIKSYANSNSEVKKLLFFLIVPSIFGLIFSFNSPLLQYFRFSYLIVFLSLLLPSSSDMSEDSFFRTMPWAPLGDGVRKNVVELVKLSNIIFLSGFIIWSFVYLLMPQFHREDWKSLAKMLESEKAPIYMIESSSDPLRYYSPDIEVRGLRPLIYVDPSTSVGMTKKSIIVIPYTADIHGIDYATRLSSSGYANSQTLSVRGITYQVWLKK